MERPFGPAEASGVGTTTREGGEQHARRDPADRPLASKVETSRRALEVEVRVKRRPDRSEPSGLGGGAKVGRGEDGRQRACKAEREDQRRVRRYQL